MSTITNLPVMMIGACVALMLIALVPPSQAEPVPVEGIDEVEFDSPMTVINSAELKIVRQRIKDGEEPQATAYRRLIEDAEAAQEFIPEPPARMTIMGGYQAGSNLSEMRALMRRESEAAYSSALAWLYSGERRYAEKATEVLDAWAKADTRFSGHDAGLQLGSWFTRLLYAADIMKSYDGWPEEAREEFEQWWRRRALPLVRREMVRRDNNWKDAGVLGVLAAAVVFEDRELLGEALAELNSYFLARRTRVSNPGENWKFAVHETGAVYFPREVTRRGRDIGPGGRGLTYTAYTLTTLVQALEIARYAGYDWWDREAENGATMKEAIAAYIRWMDLGEDFPWHKEPYRYDSDGPRRNPHEIANNHFPGEIDGLKEWLEKHRPVNGRQGDPYVTLNRGNVPPQQKP